MDHPPSVFGTIKNKVEVVSEMFPELVKILSMTPYMTPLELREPMVEILNFGYIYLMHNAEGAPLTLRDGATTKMKDAFKIAFEGTRLMDEDVLKKLSFFEVEAVRWFVCRTIKQLEDLMSGCGCECPLCKDDKDKDKDIVLD